MTETGLLYVIADKYNIVDLVRLAESLLVKQMTPSNISDFLFNFAYKYDPLRKLAMSYMVRMFNFVRKTETFARMLTTSEMTPEFAGIVEELLGSISVKDFEKVDVIDEESGEVDDEDVEEEEGEVEDEVEEKEEEEDKKDRENSELFIDTITESGGVRDDISETVDSLKMGLLKLKEGGNEGGVALVAEMTDLTIKEHSMKSRSTSPDRYAVTSNGMQDGSNKDSIFSDPHSETDEVWLDPL
jgi:hypothetical protein